MKLGSGDVSFRLGTITPTRVYLGSTEVWSNGPSAAAPEAVASVTAVASENTASAAEVSWDAPADGGAAITGYNVYVSENAGGVWTLHAEGVASPYELVIQDSGGSYWGVDVRAVNSVGEGPPAVSTATVNLSASTPAPPAMVTATAVVDVDIDVYWSAANARGSEITGYEVEWSGNASFQSAATQSTGYLIDLGYDDAGRQYQIRVRAQNAVGWSDWSEIVTVTAADVPAAPDFVSAQTDATGLGAVMVSISLAPNSDRGSPLIAYDIEGFSDSGLTNSIAFQTITEAPTMSPFERQFVGLTGGAETWVRVRLRNAIGEGQWSGAASAFASATPPGTVQDFAVTPNYSNNSWDFSWSQPGDGGSSITQYELQEDGDPEFPSPSIQYVYYQNTTFSYTPNVANATRHFRIRALNSLGSGGWSAVQSAYYAPPTVPGAPTIIAATIDGNSGYTIVAWNDPTDDGNSPILFRTFYFDGVSAQPDNTGAGTAEFYFNYGGTDLTMTATNSVGEGAISEPFPVS